MFKNFTDWLDFEFWIRTGLNHREIYNSKSGDVASLAEVTVAWLSGRHNSPPLQEISSRDLRGSERGEGLVTNLAGLLILACTSGRRWSNTLISSFLCFGHHDEVGVLSSGTPSYLRKNKGVGIPGEHTSARSTIWSITSRKVAESNSRIELIKYREQCKEVSWEVSSGQAIVRCLLQGMKGVQSNENKYCV